VQWLLGDVRMNPALHDSFLYFAYGIGCAVLALATPTSGLLRNRLYNRGLWLCCAFGLGQGGALLFFAAPELVWPHVLLKAAAAYCFFLFGWFSLRDFAIRRRAGWLRFVPFLPVVGAPAVLAVEPLWLGIELYANLGLCAVGTALMTAMVAVLGARSDRLASSQLRYRTAMLGIAATVAAFGLLTVADSVLLLRDEADSAVLGLARSGSLLAALGCVALLLRQMGIESAQREDAANAALAARTAELAVLNATLEERVGARTEELLESNTELEHEIGRHQRTEEDLRASTARLQALFDQPAVGVAFLDKDGRYMRVNARFAEMVGRPAEVLVGRRFAEITEPDELEKDRVRWDECLAGLRTSFTREKSYLRPDGVRVWIGVHSVVVPDEQRRIGHFIGLYEDIGERKRTADALIENERRLQLALAASEQSLFELDVPARRLRFAAEYVEPLGYRPEAFPADLECWLDLTHPDDRTTLLASIWACMEGQTAMLRIELRQRTAAGAWRWIMARGNIVERDADGRPTRLLGTVVDNTERHTLDERVRRTERLESIGSLAGGIAHDLNNALVPLLAGVSFLREYVPAEEEDLVKAMETSSRRAASMVQQLLVFAKGAEGRRTPVRPAALVEEMESFIHSTFPPAVRFRGSCQCKSAVVTGDPTQLHQVLLNLCVNARDAMPRGGALGLEARQVEVDAALASEHEGARVGPHVLFVVSDTGTGIPEAIRERIFDPFFTTKGPEKGTGLGLSTVLGIVRGHGGFIELQSEEGRGTRFLVYLPMAGGGTAEETQAEKAPPLPDGRGKRLLVVDDEENVRTLVARVFAGSGFEVVPACDGTEALVRLNAPGAQFDLMLLDMTMPNLGGREVLQRLREQGTRVPTVVMSGNFERQDLAWLRERGVATMTKPFHRDDLVRCASAALGLGA
jgi:PAS domain S-box-containing protein